MFYKLFLNLGNKKYQRCQIYVFRKYLLEVLLHRLVEGTI